MTKLRDFTLRDVDVPDKINSIISLNPSITETLCLIGLENKLKGVSAFCRRPESVEKIKKIGSYSTYNENIINGINPDIIFTISGYQENLTKELMKKYQVFQFELPSTPYGILDMISRVGVVTGKISNAQNLARELQKYFVPYDSNKRAYLEIDLGGPVSFGSLSYITSTLNLHGISTPFDNNLKEWLQPDYEQVRKFDPELMIFEGKMYRGTSVEETIKRLKDTPLSNTSAFRKNNIFCTPGKLDFFAHHGPSFFTSVIPWLRHILEHEIN